MLEQIEPTGLRESVETERRPDFDLRVRRIVSAVGRDLGRSNARIGGDLESLSDCLAAIGLDTSAPQARLPRLAMRLEQAAAGLAMFADRCADESFSPLAATMARAAASASACATATISAARNMTADMRGLLRAWADAPMAVAEQLSRPEWVLDGWERFCLLWETAAPTASHRAALLDMAQSLPVSPLELAAWNPDRPDIEARARMGHLSGGQDRARGGGAIGPIARNESLQALLT